MLTFVHSFRNKVTDKITINFSWIRNRRMNDLLWPVDVYGHCWIGRMERTWFKTFQSVLPKNLIPDIPAFIKPFCLHLKFDIWRKQTDEDYQIMKRLELQEHLHQREFQLAHITPAIINNNVADDCDSNKLLLPTVKHYSNRLT